MVQLDLQLVDALLQLVLHVDLLGVRTSEGLNYLVLDQLRLCIVQILQCLVDVVDIDRQ